MISLEQVRALEARVEKAVALIGSLRSENASLRTGLQAAEMRVAELEGLIQDFQKDQARIEEGIIEALRKLDSFEDSVHLAVANGKSAEQPLAEQPMAEQPLAEQPTAELTEDQPEEEAPQATDSTDSLDIF
ncbi:MAG: cell division protein ZapB [Spirochaetales bacterium]|nr:cell division protein ZapB [Spirochaetales bacterium]